MFMDYIENIAQLIAIMAALMISLFRYIGCKRHRWLYAVVFFLGNLLSSYFWTAYLIIMGDTPNVSNALAYFGWNVAFLSLTILVIHLKTKEERRYLHPFMLLPVILNIWQLTLYLPYGGVANSVYQVTVCTAALCFAVQGLLWYLKKRKEGAPRPYIAAAAAAIVIFEFGMWTSSSLEGWISSLYYPCSLLCSASYMLLVWAIDRSLDSDRREGDINIDRRVQTVLKGGYFTIVAVCSLGGILLGNWIRNILRNGLSGAEETSVYDIIPIILFLISLVIVAAAIAIVFIVYFGQKMAENQKLKEERMVADRSNEAKSEFLAHMSHEIRTPINSVLGMNEMILHDSLKAKNNLPEDEEKIREVFSDITKYAGNIDSAGNNLLSIINDILDFSKIEAGKLEIREARYELSSVLNDVSNMIVFRAQAKGLKFVVEVDDDLPDALYGDEIRLRQVLTNLLNNAVKYTQRGSVTLSVTGKKEGRYEVGKEMELTASVADTGIGIREEDLPKLFSKFERMDMEMNNTVEGTGLGLAITKQLLDMMGGTVEVKTSYGHGSEFIVKIKQKVEDLEPIGNFREKFEKSLNEVLDTEESFTAENASILIVDDTRMNLMVASGLLKETKIGIDTAESGFEALSLTEEKTYDLILLDQRMPQMDGTETLHRIKAQENGLNQKTPVICLTADAVSGAKKKYISEGFTDYLSKPIDSKALKKMVLEYLPKKKIGGRSGRDMKAIEKEKSDAKKHKDEFYEILRQGGVDPEKGVKYAQNDMGLYLKLLEEYVKSSEDKKKRLQECFTGRNMKDYTTYAHSLKSTSRTIGDDSLADLAARLEKAANGNDPDVISAEHDRMMERYDHTVDVVYEALRRGSRISTEKEDDTRGFSYHRWS